MNPINRIYNKSNCVICLDSYEKDTINTCLLLKCGHIFHKTCVADWIKQRSECPMCRDKAFVPLLMKDIIKKVSQKGIEETKKVKLYALIVIGIIIYVNTHNACKEQLDLYNDEHRYLFTSRQSEDAFKWGLAALSLVGIWSIFHIIKELRSRKNQSLELDLAVEINYTPSPIE